MKFFIRTLGCKLNQLDTARLTAALAAAGHSPVLRESEADWVLVNTCTVTAESDRKSRKAVAGALRGAPAVAVLGCGPRAAPGQWDGRFPSARVFESEDDLLAHFGYGGQGFPFPITSRTRLPVAIQNGCDDTCAFCITRLARGPHRSEPAAAVVDRVREAWERGVREVVLTGVNLAAWGAGHSKRPAESRLAVLLGRLLEETRMPRIRLSSLGPQYLGPAFFDAFSDPRVCDHLHLSLQSGSPGVLRRMDRGHGVRELRMAAERARRARPDAALTADVIAGFPAEDEAEHRETLGLLKDLGLAKLHVFPFSPRAGTAAAAMSGQLPPEVVRDRARELRELGRDLRRAFVQCQYGRTKQVLVEDDQTGLTTNYIRLRVPGAREAELRTAEVAPHLVADRW